MKKVKTEEVYDKVIGLAKNISKRKEGAIFVIAPEEKFKGTYDFLYAQILEDHYLNEKGIDAVIEKLATLDGAVLVSEKGKIVAYGARIKKSKPLPGFGTKHAAAAGITEYIKEATAILVNEKIDWIKVFQKGKIIMEMDSSKNPTNIKNKMIAFLTDHDTALVTAAGASAAIVGFAPVLIITGTYLAAKTASGLIRKNLKTEEK
ncbi:MAG TPA: diadenylate cyclase [Candidatus Nanoarchaeia archaeon]|nr:diadenylate cyclase [Candidatus Nanoarchaeia archaeon]